MTDKQLATDAEILRLCYLCDIVDGAAIVNWADIKIGDGFHEVAELLDLSTVKMTHMDYLSKLKSLSAGCDQFTALGVACAKLCDFLEADVKMMPFFAEMLHQSAVENDHKLPQELSFLNSADDDMNLAQTGVSDLKEVTARLLAEFKKIKASYGHLFPKDIQVKTI